MGPDPGEKGLFSSVTQLPSDGTVLRVTPASSALPGDADGSAGRQHVREGICVVCLDLR